MTNRITVEQAKEAYKKSGLSPTYGAYFNGQGCGCLAGAVYAAQFPERSNDFLALNSDENAYCFIGNEIENWFRDNGYSDSYLTGMIRGFDGEALGDNVTPDYRLGYQDGRAARDAVSVGLPAVSELDIRDYLSTGG